MKKVLDGKILMRCTSQCRVLREETVSACRRTSADTAALTDMSLCELSRCYGRAYDALGINNSCR
ncbi:hypothetical protein SAMN05421773_101422 [Streptomyces aidingensis]|uniref:Uncharacterized protein n=1 Tax=Streptomyces aidingensis TaxID=910347 RepID=A0A1I1ES68_9ACTN|nr:hypothetical protein SAMN05421773_101422 [Streptomyces aidingensis]